MPACWLLSLLLAHYVFDTHSGILALGPEAQVIFQTLPSELAAGRERDFLLRRD